jgi:conjugative relaxase-like TrwC/TraI family protein
VRRARAVVAVLTISSGHSARYLTDAVATGRENYYTGAVAEGEPPGRWSGAGAAALGLTGQVDNQDMLALYERYLDPRAEGFRDSERWDEVSTLGHTGRKYLTEEQIYRRAVDAEPGADAERREQLRVEASKAVRKNVAFLDATFSVQKSVTVLHTAFEAQEVAARTAGRLEEAEAWGAHRQAVEDAIWAGNKAALDYLAKHAGFCRVGHHGGAAGRWVDAHDWTVASFFQHDSRDHDPQLHIHNPILNRVQCADGMWRTLDSRAIHKFRGAAGAVAERTTEEHLAASLGVQAVTRPDGKARELVGIPAAAMDLFSSRTRAITPKHAELVDAFEVKFGRAPNGLERYRLGQQATFLTRAAKSHTGQSAAERLQGWDRRLRTEVAGGLAQVAHEALARAGQAPEAQTWSVREVLETALAAVQEKKAAWTAPDLTREISAVLPDNLGIPDGERIAALLDYLTDEGLKLAVPLDADRPGDELLPDELRRADGESAYQAPGARRYATPEHIHTERLLSAAARAGGAAALAAPGVVRFFEQLEVAGVDLGADQGAAVRGVLTSGARVESLIGPAGTGKSFVVGALAKAWADPSLWAGAQQRVFGLATSQRAAGVLVDEGLTATNTARWLATQDRLAAGRGGDEDTPWSLRRGDLVVVDESSMADTAQLAAVYRRVEAAGGKLLLVGDHRQLAAVGAGGALDLVADAGPSYELAEARRFTHDWERAASLRLRAHDPAVIEEYHRQGRIIDGGAAEQTEAAAGRAWLADTLAGKHAVLLVDDNEQAARLNAHLRAELVRLGRVAEEGAYLGREGTYAGVGDVVSARRLAWELAGYEGNTRVPTTREQYRVQQIRDDGALVVAPITGRAGGAETLGQTMVLPAGYVAEDLTLGYASTVHAAQGLSVDSDIAVVTARTSADALYPAITRGRDSNRLFVVTQAAPSRDPETGEVAQAPRLDPRGILQRILETAEIGDSDQAATTQADASAAETRAVRTPAELFADAAAHASTARTATWLDALADAGALTAGQRAQLAAEDGAATLGRVLRRAELAGHDPRQVLTAAIEERALEDARTLANVLHTRITDRLNLDPAGTSYRDWTPSTEDPRWSNYLESLATRADARRDELGDAALAEPPSWALDAFGPVPDEPTERSAWRDRAAAVAAHRELTGHTDDDTPLGAAPAPGQVEAYASWREAWRALGRPEADRDEMQMSTGRLHLRVRAYQREQAWAPRHVANELAGTIQAATTQRERATLRTAEAVATTDPERHAHLERQAAAAAALADTLETQVGTLRGLHDERASWWAHTAGTRVAAERAQAELSARRASEDATDDRTTAEEWMRAHEEAMRAEDTHREITDESDFTDHDARTAAGTGSDDLRQVADAEPDPADEHAVRVPTAAETADSVRRAQRALEEIRRREAEDAAREAGEQRTAELVRWHRDDQAAEIGTERVAADGEPVLAVGDAW